MRQTPRFNLDPTPAETPEFIDPSTYNLSWDWIGEVGMYMGEKIIAVEARNLSEILPLAGPMFERRWGQEMEAAQIGHFDSIQQGDPFILFYYVNGEKLAAALEFIKAKLTQTGILHLCKIGYADAALKVWRTFHPTAPGAPEKTQ